MTDNAKSGCDRVGAQGGFASGVAILTVSTVIVKLIGVLYKIPMIKYLGEDGMGYFNSAYEIYTFFYILATAGLPVAISILVAQNASAGNRENVKRIFGVSAALLSILGLVGAAVLYFGAPLLGRLIGNSGATASIAAISPMIFFICISSSVRGFFQGMQNMMPTAVSQVIEALGKLFPGLLLGVWAVNSGRSGEAAAAFATLGITLGVGISMIYLLLSKLFGKEGSASAAKIPTVCSGISILRSLVSIALPITLSSAVISMTRTVDLFMILRRLQSIGYTEAAANSIYGSYSTLAVSMFNLPASFVTPIALALVPALAASVNCGDRLKEQRTLNSAFRLCGVIIIPAALGMSVFSRPILELVFAGETVAINIAAPLLSVLAVSVFFSCLMTVSNAVLQAYGKERKPVISMMIGAAIKILLSYVLIGDPRLNVYGAPISTLVCDITVTSINIAFIKKTTNGMSSAWELFGRSLVAAGVSVGVCAMGYYSLVGRTLERSPGVTLVAIGLTAVIYLLLSLKIKAIDGEDIMLLPWGDKIYGIMKKIRLVK